MSAPSEERSDSEDYEEASASTADTSSSDEQTGLGRFWQRLVSSLWREFHRFGLNDLQSMNIMAVLAFWHTIAMWLSSCVLMCEVLSKLLKGYVNWMESIIEVDGQKANSTPLYMATLLRSWFTVLFYADMIRFCFWLARDAWRADAFEAYRRAICGLGGAEMRSGSLYVDPHGLPRGWPAGGLAWRQRATDLVVQALIYLSFDALPILWAVQRMNHDSLTLQKTFSIITRAGAIVGLAHALVYKLCWTATDLHLKYKGLKQAMGYGPTDEEQEFAESDRISSKVGDPDKEYTGLDRTNLRSLWCSQGRCVEFASDADSGLTNLIATEAAAEAAGDRLVLQRKLVATNLNICVRLCSFLQLVLPVIMWATAIIVGLALQQDLLIIFGFIMCVQHVGTCALNVARNAGVLPEGNLLLPYPRGLQNWSKRVWALQAWGEQCCGLEFDVQWSRRMLFIIMVSMQGLLFAALHWKTYAGFCLALVFMQLWQLTVRHQVPWGWLVSLIEAVGSVVVTAVLAFGHLPTTKRALETMMFIMAHQCGLSRKTYYGIYGYKVVRVVLTCLFAALALVVAATTLTVDPAFQKIQESMLGNVTTWYEVPFVPKPKATGLPCTEWFHLGTRDQRFSLSDFGLFSAIAYEPEDTINSTLEHFFPGWVKAHSKRAEAGMDHNGDWTTFHEFVSPDNQTTVFAVRGTSTALDALNDMIIWMPAAVMLIYNALGPDMLAPVASTMNMLSKIFGKFDNKNYQTLLKHVTERMKADRRREYFITGHSLGGGLAKIVALQALVEGLELPAVTFMSPGTLATQYLVLDKELGVTENQVGPSWKMRARNEGFEVFLRDHALMLTVMPENDIVSRIDGQAGQVVPLGCPSHGPITCHLMKTGLCQLFQECGSTRKNGTVKLPCGICGLECTPGVPTRTFPRKQMNRGFRRR